MRVSWFRVLMLLAGSTAWTGPFLSAGEATSMEAVDIGSRLELFADEHLIAEMEGVEIRLHSPWSGGKVLEFDRPWEGNTSWQLSVFKDGDLFRMYYMGRTDPTYARKAGLRPDENLTPPHPNFLCYAESRDGIQWTRPNLGLYEFNGSTENNIVTDHAGGAPLLDTRPGVDPAMRFKAPGGVGINPRFGQDSERSIGLVLWVSPDGLQWKKWREDPLFVTSLPNAFDSVNVLFWSEWGATVRLLLPVHAPGRAHLRPDHLQGPSQLDRAGPLHLQRQGPARGPPLHQRGHALFSSSSHLLGVSQALPALAADPRRCSPARHFGDRLHDQP